MCFFDTRLMAIGQFKIQPSSLRMIHQLYCRTFICHSSDYSILCLNARGSNRSRDDFLLRSRVLLKFSSLFASCHFAIPCTHHDQRNNIRTINSQVANRSNDVVCCKRNFCGSEANFLHLNWANFRIVTEFLFSRILQYLHIYKKNFFLGSRQYHNFSIIFYTTSIYPRSALSVTRRAHMRNIVLVIFFFRFHMKKERAVKLSFASFHLVYI